MATPGEEYLHIPFHAIDLNFAKFLAVRAGDRAGAVFAAAALVSKATREGHICLDLTKFAGKILICPEGAFAPLSLPEPDDWRCALKMSALTGNPGDYYPLIIDDKFRIYLYRYYDYEKKLVQFIKARLPVSLPQEDNSVASRSDSGRLKTILQALFPPAGDNLFTCQKISALLAYHQPLTIITGSPGTGKTTTVVKIIALLLSMPQDIPLRIALTAPTGKAAARLAEAVTMLKEDLNLPPSIKDIIPSRAGTIHRLLRPVYGSPYFQHHEGNELPYDVVVVDEASMVDLPLMAKLIAALPAGCKLILLGDKNQLASVEAGAILGDLSGPHDNSFSLPARELFKEYLDVSELTSLSPANAPGLQDCIIELKENYRFPSASPIGKLSAAVVRGDFAAAEKIMKRNGQAEVTWRDLPAELTKDGHLRDLLIDNFREYVQAIDRMDDFTEIFPLFNRFRLLTALREGPFGVRGLNLVIEDILKKAGLLKKSLFYPGRPIMITRNNYQLSLFNGDVGLILPDSKEDRLMAFFPGDAGGVRKIPFSLLPEHETAFALTIHKAQGSEFDHVLIILPDMDVPIMTRELIYTAVTRGKKSLAIWGKEDIFRLALSRQIERSSGLHAALWET